MRGLIFFCLLIFLIGNVFAISGVSPGSYEINFEPNLNKSFVFDFIFDEEVSAEIYVEGDLAEYVAVDKEVIIGREKVNVQLTLPESVDSPGPNRIRIGARQVVNESAGIGIAADVRGIIKLEVPYPGRYVELELIAPNANTGDLVNLTLKAFNRGEVEVNIAPAIQIFKDEEIKDESVFKNVKIKPSEMRLFNFLFNSSGYSSGDYIAVALADYGGEKPARDEDQFRLGEFYVKINNYSRVFEKGGIEEFNIEVESFWNNQIEDLYAEVKVINFEEASFVTPPIKLESWSNASLKGFLDTSKINDENFQAEIILHYGGKTTTETADLKLIFGPDYTLYMIILILILVVGLTLWRIKIFFKRVSKIK